MLYVVEIRHIGSDLGSSMTRMRTWLDHRHVEPHAFRQSAGAAGIALRVEFANEAEAVEFAETFGGRLLGAASPTEVLWR